METVLWVTGLISSVSLAIWVGLVLGHGQFWRTDQRLSLRPQRAVEDFDRDWPTVSIIVPARNEADILPQTLPTLLRQDYPGPFHIFLIDDGSDDGTAEVARQIAAETHADHRLTVLSAEPMPLGWTGKVWALQQGIHASDKTNSEFLLLTDADIAHSTGNLRDLVLKAYSDPLDLVSLMAHLRVTSVGERLLIPAFVYFFAKLYPFRWVNDPRKSTAGAAGGCVLVRREALERAGGFESIAGMLIDDCALAKRIKEQGKPAGGRIWLGLSREVHSLRIYSGLTGVWRMVARTAFTQLRYSPLLLVGTVVGMLLIYLAPPLSALGGLVSIGVSREPALSGWLAATGLAAWTLMVGSYLPMLRWYGVSSLLAFLLPVTAMLYTLMTIDSALQFWRGRGGGWKERTYPTT